MRSSTPWIGSDCLTYCRPTRMAVPSRSRPSGCGRCSRFQRATATAAASASTALATKTQALPALAMSPPASKGPRMREPLLATPLRASAAGSCARDTSSGTTAANTGQRMAMPTPLAQVRASSSPGVMAPMKTMALSTSATTATQSWVNR